MYFQGVHSHRLEVADRTTIVVYLTWKPAVRSLLVSLKFAQVLKAGLTIGAREVTHPSGSAGAWDRGVHVVPVQQVGSQAISSGKLGAANDARHQLGDVEAHLLQVLLEVGQVSVAFDGVEGARSEGTVPAVEVAVLLRLLGVHLGLVLHQVERGVRAEVAEAAVELLRHRQVLRDLPLVVAGDHVLRQLGGFAELVLAQLAMHPPAFDRVLLLNVLLQS